MIFCVYLAVGNSRTAAMSIEVLKKSFFRTIYYEVFTIIVGYRGFDYINISEGFRNFFKMTNYKV